MNDQIKALMLAHNKLLGYAKLMWPQYSITPHIKKIAKALEAVERGEITRLIIEAPPRHSKSMTVSDFFPAWYMGRNPTQDVIYGTYSQRLANKFGRAVRNRLIDPVSELVFPKCSISSDSKAKDYFTTESGGEYRAVGVGGSITGSGGKLIILDDTVKGREQAESEAYKETLYDWYRSTIYTRQAPGASIVVMGTRWTEEDLIGYVLKEQAHENWHRLTFPALNDDETEALWPERFDVARLLDIKNALGLYDWNALYMQRPSAKEGNIIKDAYIQYYNELPKKFEVVCQSWDFTFKDKRTSDYVVGQIWGRSGSNCYLIDQFRDRADFPASIQAIIRMTNLYPEAKIKLIEDKANGPAIISMLKNKIAGIKPVNPQATKLERLNKQLYLFQGGNIFLPHPSLKPWVKDYVDELKGFPNSKYDDCVDATTQALDEIGVNSAVQKYLDFLSM